MDHRTVVEGLCEATGQKEVRLTSVIESATDLLAIGKLDDHSEALLCLGALPDMPLMVLDDRYGEVPRTTLGEAIASMKARDIGPETGTTNGGEA
jgi:hypothetical protein